MVCINGDCFNVMSELIQNGTKVDMILTDPPYLINYKTNYRINKKHDFCKAILNDNNPELIKKNLPVLNKLLKDGGAIYMFCNSNHIDFFKQEFEKYFKFKNILIWVKNNWTAGDLKGAYAKKTEFILFGSKGRHILNGKRNSDVLSFKRVVGKKQLHQNQKPVDLLEFLIKKSSNEGDTVLDCFMGSGSTGVACVNTNRNFIGIELDNDYFNIAKKRIGDEIN